MTVVSRCLGACRLLRRPPPPSSKPRSPRFLTDRDDYRRNPSVPAPFPFRRPQYHRFSGFVLPDSAGATPELRFMHMGRALSSAAVYCSFKLNSQMQAAVRRRIPKLSSSLSLSPLRHFAPFHSTPAVDAKASRKGGGSDREPSEPRIRFTVRLKRVDPKKALKDHLLFGKPLPSQNDRLGLRCAKSTSRNSASGKGKHGGSKRWKKKHSVRDDDDEFEPYGVKVQAAFDAGSYSAWGFSSWDEYVKNFPGFDRKEESKEKTKRRSWNESDNEDDEPSDMIDNTHRRTLGLPSNGPLMLDDVKRAFRTSALKWHPDKHEGHAQVIAEEKFKQCVEAYGAICDALKSA